MYRVKMFPGDTFHTDTYYVLHSITLEYAKDTGGKELVFLAEAHAAEKCRELNG